MALAAAGSVTIWAQVLSEGMGREVGRQTGQAVIIAILALLPPKEVSNP